MCGEFVTNNNMVIVSHPPYPLDLAPSDLTLFPKLKMRLKDEILKQCLTSKGESKVVLDNIKENDFHGAFEGLEKRWDRCIRSKEDYLKELAARIE
jgi:hypothetical protein